MPRILEELDRALAPLSDKIATYLEGVGQNVGCLYDADWGGLPSQAIVNRIFSKLHGKEPKSHWITYDGYGQALRWLERHGFEHVLLFDYEPHSEIEKIKRCAKAMGIFGHHVGREDIERLAKGNEEVVYFNPNPYLLDIRKRVYERGAPISYALLQAAAKMGVDASPAGEIGLRGYGYRKLWDELLAGTRYEERRGIERLTDNFIEDVNLLIAWDLDNCSTVVRTLTDGKGFSDIDYKGIRAGCIRNKLNERRNKDRAAAIARAKIIGDVEVFPIRTAFKTIKPFTSSLDKLRAKSEYYKYGRDIRLRTTICARTVSGSKIKFSVRTDADVDLPSLLERTFAALPDIERNYGAHPSSGGMISPADRANELLAEFLRNYFEQTGQEPRPATPDLISLLNRSNSSRRNL